MKVRKTNRNVHALSIGTKIDDIGRPWMAIIYWVTLCACLSEPITKMWMKIDSYCQRRKRSAHRDSCLWGYKGCADIRGGSLDWGIKWEWGRRKLPLLLLVVATSFEISYMRPDRFPCDSTVLVLWPRQRRMKKRNITHATRERWVGRNSSLIVHRLWTKVHQIKFACVREIAVCNAVFHSTISDRRYSRISCKVV